MVLYKIVMQFEKSFKFEPSVDVNKGLAQVKLLTSLNLIKVAWLIE